MKKNPEQTAATREKLKNAFWDIYSEKPLNAITVSEVAKRAGYNRSTFYTYYKDIYDILEQTEEEILEMLRNGSYVKFNLLDRTQYQRDMMYFGDFLRKNQKCLTILFGENGDPKLAYQIWRMMREKFIEDISSVETKLPPEMYTYVAEYIVNAHAGAVMMWLRNGCDIPFETLVDTLFRLVSGGIVPVILGDKTPYEQFADIVVKRIRENFGEEFSTMKEDKR